MFEHRKIVPLIYYVKSGETFADLGLELLEIQTSKSLEDQPGTFSMTFIAREEVGGGTSYSNSLIGIYKMMEPGDLISIGFEIAHGTMLGRIETLSKNLTKVGSKLSKTLHVSGSELGKDLLLDNFRNIPAKAGTGMLNLKSNIDSEVKSKGANPNEENKLTQEQDESTKKLNEQRQFAPKEFIRDLFTKSPALKTEVDFFGQRKTLGALIEFNGDVSAFGGESVEWGRANTLLGSSIISLLWNGLDKEFYELFWDTRTREDMPYIELVIRPRPWDRKDDPAINPQDGTFLSKTTVQSSSEKSFLFENLRTYSDPNMEYHEIYDDQILDINLGVSSSNVYSAYSVEAAINEVSSGQDVKVGSQNPIIDMNMMHRFGYREYKLSSVQINVKPMNKKNETTGSSNSNQSENEKNSQSSEEQIKTARDLAIWKASRLFNWNCYNLYFESGSVSIIGRESIRIGERIRLVDEPAKDGTVGMEGYITGVNHSWGYGGMFKTTLNIIRCMSDETRSQLKSFEKVLNLGTPKQ